jgi:hypothetical protein
MQPHTELRAGIRAITGHNGGALRIDVSCPARTITF